MKEKNFIHEHEFIFDPDDPATVDKLIAYSRNELSDSEAYEVEKLLIANPLARAAYESLGPGWNEAEFRQDVDAVKRQVNKSIGRSRKRFAYGFTSAAAVILLLILTLLIVNRDFSANERLFAAYFKPIAAEMLPLRGDNRESARFEAFLAYNRGDYALAATQFESLLASNPGSDTLALYSALAHIMDEEYAAALGHLEGLENNSSSSYYEHAEWYLALLYLRQDNTARCRALMQGIAARKAIYWEEASQILGELEK